MAIEQKPRTLVRVCLLHDRHLLERHLLVSFPQEDRARGIPAIERVEQVAHTGRSPDVATLHLRQAQLAAFNHANEFFDRCLSFRHLTNPICGGVPTGSRMPTSIQEVRRVVDGPAERRQWWTIPRRHQPPHRVTVSATSFRAWSNPRVAAHPQGDALPLS